MLQVLLCLGAQPSVPAPGSLVAYFPFDEGVNDVRNAISGTAVSGSLGSPLSPPLTGNAAVTSSCGHDGGAGLSLSGGYVNYGTPSALNFHGKDAITIMMWIKGPGHKQPSHDANAASGLGRR